MTSPSDPSSSTLLLGRFVVGAPLAEAPGAIRYQANAVKDGQEMLLVVLEPSECVANPDLAQLAAAVAAFQEPSGLKAESLQYGSQEGRLWVTRPWRTSPSLLDLIRTQTRLPLPEAVEILVAIARIADALQGSALPGIFLAPDLVAMIPGGATTQVAPDKLPKTPLAQWPGWSVAPEPAFFLPRADLAEPALFLASDDQRGVRRFVVLLCEILGRPIRPAQTAAPVIPILGEEGNSVLQRAWSHPDEFATYFDFAEQLRGLTATGKLTAPKYEPHPIETQHVQLPPELQPLGERLAEHIHDLWSEQRISEGWRWGPRRDDARREHQDLVPYSHLTEGEKEYDRRTAAGTLKAIIALGFGITPPVPPEEVAGPAESDSIDELAKAATGSVRSIQLAWNPPPLEKDEPDPAVQKRLTRMHAQSKTLRKIVLAPQGVQEGMCRLSKAALDYGELFLASEIARVGLAEVEKLRDESAKEGHALDPRLAAREVLLLHRQALCRVGLGNTVEGEQLIARAMSLDPGNSDVIAALGRIAKDRALAATTAERRRFSLQQSRHEYERALSVAVSPDQRSYVEINIAAVSLWLGEAEAAEASAGRVLACLDAAGKEDEWSLLTRAEAHLIRREQAQAYRYYQQARAELGPKSQWRALHAARRQARRHADALHIPAQEIDDVFQFPVLIAFSGHIPDRPGRASARFPAALEAAAAGALREGLAKLRPGFSLLSAAAGGDILCLEALSDMVPAPERHVVLPWKKGEFIAESVSGFEGGQWEERFAVALEQATTVSYLSQQTRPLGSGDSYESVYEHLNRCLIGMALLRARLLDLQVVPVVLWDGRAGKPGGTASFAGAWQKLGYGVVQVPVAGGEMIEVRERELPPQPVPETIGMSPLHARVFAGRPTVQTMLFADVVGYSKIPEHQIGLFAPRFLGLASKLVDTSSDRPIFSNTWGDALYFVFDEPAQAGRFALDLCDAIQKTDWAAAGLPKGLNLRVALHTGPVFMGVDPILREITFNGSHVSHAARIEPVTAKGEVWASESFAAHVAVGEAAKGAPPTGFALDYLGQIDFAKNYGRYPLFRVRRVAVD